MTQPMIDYDYDRSGAIRMRAEMVSGFLKRTRMGERIGSKFAAFGAALAVATGLFWATMLTSPAPTQAADTPIALISTTYDGALACIASFVCP